MYPDGTEKNLFYIFGNTNLAAIYIQEISKEEMGYVISDHLGSVWVLANDQMQIINMKARLYDPIMGQFISVDPLADKFPGWSAYVYCYNNPLMFTDPTGMEGEGEPDKIPPPDLPEVPVIVNR